MLQDELHNLTVGEHWKLDYTQLVSAANPMDRTRPTVRSASFDDFPVYKVRHCGIVLRNRFDETCNVFHIYRLEQAVSAVEYRHDGQEFRECGEALRRVSIALLSQRQQGTYSEKAIPRTEDDARSNNGRVWTDIEHCLFC